MVSGSLYGRAAIDDDGFTEEEAREKLQAVRSAPPGFAGAVAKLADVVRVGGDL